MPSVNVGWKLPEYNRFLDQWRVVSDCIAGEQAIKFRRQKYLIPPQPLVMADAKQQEENVARFQSYLQGAVFYNVTARTLRGMVGQVFARPPEIKVPDQLKPLLDDISGLGVQVNQQLKEVVGQVTSHGRAGLLSDFPTAERDADGKEKEFSIADIQSGRVRPTVTKYGPDQIINWRYSRTTHKKLLLVVLVEDYEDETSDIFVVTKKQQFRVLRIDENGYYRNEVYRDMTAVYSYTAPRFADGSRFNYIPFEFIGSEDNDPSVDEVTMFPLASINIKHYNNSAIYEEMLTMMGQPTLSLTGLSKEWVNDVLGGAVYLGSKSAILLPTGGKAEILQVNERQGILAAMEHKERQMVALGARLVEQQKVQRTATEANQEEASESSTLSTIADNTSAAYANAFYSCSRFISNDEPPIVCKLNTQFELQTLSPEALNAVINIWVKEAIAFEEMRSILRRGGYASLSDAQARAKIDNERADLLAAGGADPNVGIGDNNGNANPNAGDDE